MNKGENKMSDRAASNLSGYLFKPNSNREVAVVCKNKHIICVDCLCEDKPEKIRDLENNFLCPECEEENRKMNYFINDHRRKLITNDLTEFKRNCEDEKISILINRNNEISKYNKDLAKIYTKVEKRLSKHKTEINRYFNEKDSELQNLLDQFRHIEDNLNEFLNDFTTLEEIMFNLKANFNLLATENKQKKVIYYSNTDNFNFSLLNSEVSINFNQKPKKESKVIFRSYPRKIVSSKSGFYALLYNTSPKNCQVYDILNNKSTLSLHHCVEDFEIDRGSENDDIYFLCPMQKGNYEKDKIIYKIEGFEKRPEVCIYRDYALVKYEKEIDFEKSIYFAVFDNLYLYNKEKRALSVINFQFWIQEIKVISNDAYILLQDKSIYKFDNSNKTVNKIDVILSIGDFSLRQDIIEPLFDGKNLLLADMDNVYVINMKSNICRYYYQQKIAEDERLLNYTIKENELILCSRKKTTVGELILKYYERMN